MCFEREWKTEWKKIYEKEKAKIWRLLQNGWQMANNEKWIFSVFLFDRFVSVVQIQLNNNSIWMIQKIEKNTWDL